MRPVAVKKIVRQSFMTHQQTVEAFRKEVDILVRTLECEGGREMER